MLLIYNPQAPQSCKPLLFQIHFFTLVVKLELADWWDRLALSGGLGNSTPCHQKNFGLEKLVLLHQKLTVLLSQVVYKELLYLCLKHTFVDSVLNHLNTQKDKNIIFIIC